MKNFLLSAAAIGTVLALAAPAEAREGCGRGMHRGPHGRCLVNRGPAQHVWVEHRFYPGHGYRYQNRWYKHRYQHHGGWRYR